MLRDNGAGGAHHLVASGLDLGKGHYLPDIRLVFEEHDQAIHPRRYAPVRRRPVAQRLEYRPEPALGLVWRYVHYREDLLLQIGAVYPNAPRGELRPVGDKISSLLE